MNWFWSNMIGNVRLLVREEDAQNAEQILSQPVPEKFETDREKFEQPKCPQCKSVDLQFEGVDQGIGLTTAWVLAPIPVRRNAWKCNSCGLRWKDDPEQSEGDRYDA
jgi:rubrerythrin